MKLSDKNREKLNLYFWSGIDVRGQRTFGSERVSCVTVLKYKLLKQQITCVQVNKQNQNFISARQWLNSKYTLFFLTQLAAILKTGINLNKAIAILKSNQQDKVFLRLYEDIHRRLKLGKSLSQTLKHYPHLFDNISLHIIKSGEIVGHTDSAIKQAGDYLQQKRRTSSDILTALLYPIILSLVTLGVLCIMMIFVIPQFETLFSGSDNSLPLLTRIVLSASDFIRMNVAGLFVLFLLTLAFYKLVQKFIPINLFRLFPRLNRTLTQINTLRLCQTLSNLYRFGLPITQALESCKYLSNNYQYQQAISHTLYEIQQGSELAQALNSSNYFEPVFIQLIQTGEQAASLNSMLEQCADFYEKQLNDNLARLKIVLEPLLIVALGMIIGIILIAMYLPVFNMGSSF